MSSLQVTTIRCYLKATSAQRFHDEPGDVWHGALKNALRRQLCTTLLSDCSACPAQSRCEYTRSFGKQASGQTQPRLYTVVANSPKNISEGDWITIDIGLLGPAILLATRFVYAVEQCAGRGVLDRARSRNRTRYTLERVREFRPDRSARTLYRQGQIVSTAVGGRPVAPPVPEVVQVLFQTPLMLREHHQVLGWEQISVSRWVKRTISRIRWLSEITNCSAPNYVDLGDLEDTSWIQRRQFGEVDALRFSSTQSRRIPSTGYMGEAHCAGAPLADAWEALWLGQWTHCGSRTVYGFGRYRLSGCKKGESGLEHFDGRARRSGSLTPT